MEKSTKTDGATTAADAPESAQNERRRLSRIVHDDRGNASVQWHDAPSDYQRPVFEIESATGTHRGLRVLGSDPLSLEPQNEYDPYACQRPVERKGTRAGSTSRTDLRKLSEWIKMKRELEEQKLRADSDDTDAD